MIYDTRDPRDYDLPDSVAYYLINQCETIVNLSIPNCTEWATDKRRSKKIREQTAASLRQARQELSEINAFLADHRIGHSETLEIK